jgi:hypothetical protein
MPRKNEPDDADFAASLEGLVEALDKERGGPPGGRTPGEKKQVLLEFLRLLAEDAPPEGPGKGKRRR